MVYAYIYITHFEILFMLDKRYYANLRYIY